MPKISKSEPYTVGQRVWLEELSWFHSRDDVRTASEFEVVKANNTSAYAVRIERIDDYKKGERVATVRIDQRTRNAKNSVSRFNVWLSDREFKDNILANKELEVLRSKAIRLVKQMNADELRKVLEI